MPRANETSAAFMTEGDAIRDREQFVRNLGNLLSQTREGIMFCKLIDAEQPSEHVAVVYKGAHMREIPTYMDSYAAIIKDIAKGL